VQTFGLPQLEPVTGFNHNLAIVGVYPNFS
jgi:hypothetical protein